MSRINKEDITIGELNSLCPTYGLFDDVEFEQTNYYRDDDTKQLWEISCCSNGDLSKRINQLEKMQSANSLLNAFGIN